MEIELAKLDPQFFGKNDLRRAAHRDAHAWIQPVLRTGKRRGHLRRAADQRHGDESHV